MTQQQIEDLKRILDFYAKGDNYRAVGTQREPGVAAVNSDKGFLARQGLNIINES